MGNNLVIANKDKDAHNYRFSNFIVKVYLRETLTPVYTGCTRCSAVAFVITKKKKLAIIKCPLKNGWINWHIHPIEFKQWKMNELKLYDDTDESLNITWKTKVLTVYIVWFHLLKFKTQWKLTCFTKIHVKTIMKIKVTQNSQQRLLTGRRERAKILIQGTSTV